MDRNGAARLETAVRCRPGPHRRGLAGTLPLEVMRHKINRGLGETAGDLFERAAETCAAEDVIVRMDCDDAHEPEGIARMITEIEAGYDVVIASRFRPGGGQIGVGAY